MMENKLWIALCALLLFINVGSADHEDAHAAAPTSMRPIGAEATPSPPVTNPLPGSSVNQTTHASATTSALNGSDTNPSSNGNATTNVGTQPIGSHNDTNTVSVPDNKNLTNTSTLQPPVPQFENHTSTSHVAPNSTIASPTHATHTAPAATSTKTPPLNNSTPLLPDTITASSQPTHPQTHSPISSPAPKLPGTTSPKTKPVPTNTTASTQSTLTSSTSPSQKPPITQPPTTNAPQPNTTKSKSEVHSKTTISTPISTSAQAKAHDDNPSQLNVGGNTAHESPTLDPLLAGLVSAFIITAVIITLLLFLKLRRRDNRPEFRRLQDLPMDDMMEDTPLSMYSY